MSNSIAKSTFIVFFLASFPGLVMSQIQVLDFEGQPTVNGKEVAIGDFIDKSRTIKVESADYVELAFDMTRFYRLIPDSVYELGDFYTGAVLANVPCSNIISTEAVGDSTIVRLATRDQVAFPITIQVSDVFGDTLTNLTTNKLKIILDLGEILEKVKLGPDETVLYRFTFRLVDGTDCRTPDF